MKYTKQLVLDRIQEELGESMRWELEHIDQSQWIPRLIKYSYKNQRNVDALINMIDSIE